MRGFHEIVGPPWHKFAFYILELATALESLSGISVYALQTTKSASLGGRQVLDCQLDLPSENSNSPHIIQWMKDGLENPVIIKYDGYGPNFHDHFKGRIRLVDGVSLEISHIRPSDEGWYECTVIYVDGVENKKDNGSWVYLNVHTPPSIVESSPSSVKRRPGDTVVLFCRASGSPEPTVTWTKNYKNLIVSQRISLNNKGTEVEIKNLQWSDIGIYTCIFDNSVGKISKLINLIIEGGAYILSPPVNRTAIEGERITFTCGADAYPGNITYQWYKDGRNINLLPGYSNRLIIYPNGNLVISSVNKDDMAWYNCRPSNGFGEDPEASAYLNVTFCPKYHKMPSQMIWARGYQARLDCLFDANPTVTEIVWTKNGYIVDFSSAKLSQLMNGSLFVQKVTDDDSGAYSCSPLCSLGSGKSSQLVQVVVRDPPRFILRPLVKYIRIPDQSVLMPCAAMGTPKPNITWRKVRGVIKVGGRIKLSGGNLTIQNLIKEDHGQYECEAKNDVTTIVTTTELIIEMTTPHAPYNVTVEPGPFSATVRWIPAYNGGSIQKYMLWYRNFNGERNKWKTLAVNSPNATSYIIYVLQPDTVYEFMVLSRNEYGNGTFSERVQAKTTGYTVDLVTALPVDGDGSTFFPPIDKSRGPKPAAPVNVTAVLKGNNIVVRWRAPKNSTVKIFYYWVDYLEGYAKSWESTGVKIIAPETSYIFKNIKPGTEYKFRVFSNGVMAFSLPSKIVSVTTPSGIQSSASTDSPFFLSNAEIGGIVGGLLFLLVAVLLAVIAVICSKKKDRKRTERYGNVKYIGPADGAVNAKIESSSEWDNWNTNRRRNPVSQVDLGKGIFIVPQPSDFYKENQARPQKFSHDSWFYNHDNIMFDPDKGYEVPVQSPDNVQIISAPAEHSHSMERSRYTHSNDLSPHSVIQTPRRSPWRPPASPDHESHSLSSSRFPNERDISMRSQDSRYYKTPQRPHATSPLTSPLAGGYDGPFFSFHGDDDDVFPPFNESYPPLSRPSRPSLPRHSSMKPASLKTYLTDDPDDFGQPFETTEISSVMPSSILEQSPSQASQYYDPRLFDSSMSHSHESQRSIPYRSKSQDRLPRSFQSGTFPAYARDPNRKQLNDRHSSYIPQNRSFPLEENYSSDSSGRPMAYTREHLQGAVDKIRKGPRARKSRLLNRNSAPDLDSYYPDSPSFSGSLKERVQKGPYYSENDVTAPRHEHSFPGAGRTHGYDFEPLRTAGDSRTSISSSGRGSAGRMHSAGSETRPYHMMDEATPDSISSGIGSKNTSQATGSSAMSRVPKNNASWSSVMTPREQDFSADSSPFFDSGNSFHRRDTSADENYEFDTVNALETDLMDALRNYSRHSNGNNQLLSALETGLTESEFYNDLYPKPSRQSRYDDSEKRFERLREEFQEYRRKQQEQPVSLAPMDSEML